MDVELVPEAQPSPTGGNNLDRFSEDVDAIEELLKMLEDGNEESKTLQNVKDLQSKMVARVSVSLDKAKLIRVRLVALENANDANRKVTGCGLDSPTDRKRTSAVLELRKKLAEKMSGFQKLQGMINAEHRDAVQRQYLSATGESPDEKTVDSLIRSGDIESFLHKAIQQHGRERVMGTITEIQERHGVTKDLNMKLSELFLVFFDMVVLSKYTGCCMGGTETQQFFYYARPEASKRWITRKRACNAIIILFVHLVVIYIGVTVYQHRSS